MMPSILPAFAALYLAHLATDFLFQSRRMVAEKGKGKWSGYLRHGAIHFIAATACTLFLSAAWAWNLGYYAVLAALTILHLSIDRGKVWLSSRGALSDGAALFFLDQTVHAGTVLAAAMLLAGVPLREWWPHIICHSLPKEKILFMLAVYTGVMFGGGFAVRYLTKSLLRRTPGSVEESAEQLENAGMYIGWLERFLVLTALALHSPATIGLILTAKSIARYPEFKSVRFAEYYLIGTLLSMSLGIIGGLMLLKVFYGTIRF